MKLQKEELILASLLLPLAMCLAILLSTVKAPHELFAVEIKKPIVRNKHKVAVKDSPKEEPKKVESLPSLSQSLSQPASSLGGDLQSLSAGLVSESSGGGGGMNVTQGDSQTMQLVAQTEGQTRPARALQVVNPTYPQSAQARGIEGYVILELVISDRGFVTEAKVLSAQPQGLFEQVAIEAIKKWTFEPGLESGKTILSRIKQKVNFELN
jgi:protein TonB